MMLLHSTALGSTFGARPHPPQRLPNRTPPEVDKPDAPADGEDAPPEVEEHDCQDAPPESQGDSIQTARDRRDSHFLAVFFSGCFLGAHVAVQYLSVRVRLGAVITQNGAHHAPAPPPPPLLEDLEGGTQQLRMPAAAAWTSCSGDAGRALTQGTVRALAMHASCQWPGP